MESSVLVKEKINNGAFDGVFSKLYSAEKETIETQKKRYVEAIECFEQEYGINDITLYSVPGRTEIGGNHTDHNHGKVLAAAVNLDIIAVVSQNKEDIARVKSKGFKTVDVVDLSILEPSENEFGCSSALIRGVAAGIKKRGGTVGGFNAYTASDVLRGSGLSSSAAFEVCMGAILNGEYNEGRFTNVELGMIGQYAENEFFGKPSGLMDQTACAVGSAITIDFADPQNPIVQEIPFDLEALGYKLVITDTKGSHAGLTDEYAAIRTEMMSVAEYFGKQVLREVSKEKVLEAVPALREKLGDRAVLRALHFFEECRRVDGLSAAIKAEDFETFKKLLIESGHSSFEYNQNAYSVKHPNEQGVSMGLALSQNVLRLQGAWRLQGGGFAGTIQAFVPNALLNDYCNLLQNVFGNDACYVLSVRNTGATQVTVG